MAEGIVYIVINEAMPGLCKIGITENSVESRIRQLDTTSVPLPFQVYYAARVADIQRVERLLHDAFLDTRVRKSREFFRVSPERVKSALLLATLSDETPKTELVENNDDQEALDKARARRSAISLEKLGILPNAILISTFDDVAQCTVLDHKAVLFEGARTSLSAAALIVANRNGYKWQTLAGPNYWTYNGKTLSEIREDAEATESAE
jgi:T5orf172 domain